jgi:lysophospholipid acyltransferase
VLELASYVFYFGACGCGPFFEYSDYKRFIEETGEYRNTPSPILPSLKWFAQALFCLGISEVGKMFVPIEFCWSDGLADYSFPYRVWYYYWAMHAKKFFYYTPFSFTTGAVVASGLGYNGNERGTEKWDKIIGVYVWELETSGSPVDMWRYWNH